MEKSPSFSPTAWNEAMNCAVQLHGDRPHLDVSHVAGLQHPVLRAAKGHLAADIPREQNDIAGLHGRRGPSHPVAGAGSGGNDHSTDWSVIPVTGRRSARLPVFFKRFGW